MRLRYLVLGLSLVLVSAAAVVAGSDRLAQGPRAPTYGSSFSLPLRGEKAYRLNYVGEFVAFCAFRDRRWLSDLQAQGSAEQVEVVLAAGLTRSEAVLIVDRAGRDGAAAARADYITPEWKRICAVLPLSPDTAEADQVVARWRGRDWSNTTAAGR